MAARTIGTGLRRLYGHFGSRSMLVVNSQSHSPPLLIRQKSLLSTLSTPSVTKDASIVKITRLLTSLVLDDPGYMRVYESILDSYSSTTQQLFANSPQQLASQAPQLSEGKRKKLLFKLGRIAISLDKLVYSLSTDIINDLDKYHLLVSTLLEEMNNNTVNGNCELTSLEFDLSFINEETFNYILNNAANASADETDDDEEEEENIVDESYLSQLNFGSSLIEADKKKAAKYLASELKRKQRQLDELLASSSRRLDEESLDRVTEFKENVLANIQSEIDEQVRDLAADFPNIAVYVNQMKLRALRTWLDDYNDEFFRSTFASTTNSESPSSSSSQIINDSTTPLKSTTTTTPTSTDVNSSNNELYNNKNNNNDKTS